MRQTLIRGRLMCVLLASSAIWHWQPQIVLGEARFAFYIVSTSVEGEEPAVRSIYLTQTGREMVSGREMNWWEIAAVTREGASYGLRILSDRVPMTSPDGIGEVHRYVYRDVEGHVLEYRDAATGRALLPLLQFEQSFVPRPARDAVYEDGFASSGAFLGHVLVRARPMEPAPVISFDRPILLELRSDLIVGPQAAVQAESTPTDSEPKHRACTPDEHEQMIARGVNYHDANGDNHWLVFRPVFFRAEPTFPDTFYRANWIPGRMFIDEPSVRLGWSGGISSQPRGPEQVAEAMRQRVESHYVLAHRQLRTGNGNELGTLDLVADNAVSWDTDYWSAWYQLAAGAPAVIHEGRYVQRGYGWEPEDLYGADGLGDLTFDDQLNCLFAFLRGAARAFDGDWGMSVYPEGDPKLRLPAMIRAYDMGARYIWFWTFPPNMSFEVELPLAEGLTRHAVNHPREPLRDRNRAAKVGIAMPPGHVFSWQGTWGMQREQRSRGGTSFGDISAAVMWEGILCSRRGIPFDFLVDEPHIRDLGYDRLVIVRADESLDVNPPWDAPRAAKPISLELTESGVPEVVTRQPGAADYLVRRASGIAVDGRLDDWSAAEWIPLRSDTQGFADMTRLETTVINDLAHEKWRLKFGSWMGLSYAQVDDNLERKYHLEDLQGRGVVVTHIDPGSPAADAGIREGDVIVGLLEWPINWYFQMYQRLEGHRNTRDRARVPVRLRRSGRYDFGEPGDIAADIALAVDDENLYVAARVIDDVHWQPHYDWEYWKGDSVQIGFDPTLERRNHGYGEQDHEVGLILSADRSVAWRYHGRRGQALGEMPSVRTAIVREHDTTVYEAAIPLADLTPLSPDMWPIAGFNIVVNDSDGGPGRQGRLELRSKAMTQGKRTAGFATMRFEPSADMSKVSTALVWQRRATPENGHFRVVIAARSPESREARLTARLKSLDSQETPGQDATISLPVMDAAREHGLLIRTASPPGRYDLEIRVTNPEGGLEASDHLPVYVSP